MASVLNPYSSHTHQDVFTGEKTVAHLHHTLGGLNYEGLKTGVEQTFLGKWYGSLSILVVLLHVLAFFAYQNIDHTTPPKAEKREILVEIYRPEPVIEPPKPAEPPKPKIPPPPPKVVKAAPAVPKPAPVLKTEAADENIQPDDIVVAENTEAPTSTAPVVSSAEPAPEKASGVGETAPVAAPAPPPEEPVTEASANAAYLNNPKPEYPRAAEKMGWSGTVILRVRVLASGAAESVQVKKTSGKKVLDEAAINAVKNWTFVPSKRGSTPIDGWATVPIEFKNPEQ